MAGETSTSAGTKSWLYHPVFPDHWERRALYTLAQWVNGLAFRDIQFSPTGKPVIKIAEIKGGISGQTKFTEQVFDESVHVRAGDLLFSWSGQPETSIDVFWWRGSDGWLNQHSFRVTPVEGIDPTFFYYLLKYLNPSFVGIARNKQTTGLGHVTKRDMENIEAAYPPLDEQCAIAHILGMLDDKIELNRKMNETLEAMARAIFKSWFVDFDPVRAKSEGRPTGLPEEIDALFPDSFDNSELGEIPAGWKICSFAELAEVNPHRPIKKGSRASYIDMTSLSTSCMHISKEPIYRTFLSGSSFKNGDILFARITPCLENGKTALVCFLPKDVIGMGSTEFIVFGPKISGSYFNYCIARWDEFRNFAIQKMTGSSGRQRVPNNSFEKFLTTNPGEKILSKFENIVEPLFKRAAQQTQQSRTLAAIRDALLPKFMNGYVRVAYENN